MKILSKNEFLKLCNKNKEKANKESIYSKYVRETLHYWNIIQSIKEW